jgi:hypothetical protein
MTDHNSISDLVLRNGSGEEESLEALLQQELEQDFQGFRITPIRVKIEHRAQVFSFPDGSTKRSMEGIILKSQIIRGFWKPNNPKPVCASADGITGTDAVGNAHECMRCKNNQWGSAVKLDENGQPVQGKGKACKEMRRLLFLEDGADLPVMLNVPPSSLKRFDSFATLCRARKQPLIATRVVLRLIPANADGIPYAQINPEIKERVSDKEVLRRLFDVRDMMLRAVDFASVDEADLEEPVGEAEVGEADNGEYVDLGDVKF